jgi:hypothetical protein
MFRQNMQNMMSVNDPYSEKPRANFYSVAKHLRENMVRILFSFCCILEDVCFLSKSSIIHSINSNDSYNRYSTKKETNINIFCYIGWIQTLYARSQNE